MKKTTILKAVGLAGAAAAAGAIAYKNHQTDKKMQAYNKKVKFKGNEIKFESEFESDSIAVNLSGVEIDFTQATLKDNKGRLDLYAELAGIDIVVPEEWHVELVGSNHKSGVNSSFSGIAAENQPVLTIHYELRFAGLNVRKPSDDREDESECCCGNECDCSN